MSYTAFYNYHYSCGKICKNIKQMLIIINLFLKQNYNQFVMEMSLIIMHETDMKVNNNLNIFNKKKN